MSKTRERLLVAGATIAVILVMALIAGLRGLSRALDRDAAREEELALGMS
ncbi:hypothetical protein [Microbacterium sediminis]|nr:hypothetical protein [Microbacterium sediminis]